METSAPDNPRMNGLDTSAFLHHNANKIELRLGDWTLSIYAGRVAGTLPGAAPAMVLYRGFHDDRKQTVYATEVLTPNDPGFAEKLNEALNLSGKANMSLDTKGI